MACSRGLQLQLELGFLARSLSSLMQPPIDELFGTAMDAIEQQTDLTTCNKKQQQSLNQWLADAAGNELQTRVQAQLHSMLIPILQQTQSTAICFCK